MRPQARRWKSILEVLIGFVGLVRPCSGYILDGQDYARLSYYCRRLRITHERSKSVWYLARRVGFFWAEGMRGTVACAPHGGRDSGGYLSGLLRSVGSPSSSFPSHPSISGEVPNRSVGSRFYAAYG